MTTTTPPDYSTWTSGQLVAGEAAMEGYLGIAAIPPVMPHPFPRMDTETYVAWLAALQGQMGKRGLVVK